MHLLNEDNPKYSLDYDRPVKVYRNLHRGCWSVLQDGLVKAHTDIAYLIDPVFQVNLNGRARVLVNKAKEVHAWLTGILHKKPESVREIGDMNWSQVKYDPYKFNSFVRADNKEPVEQAKYAWMITPSVWIR